MSSEVTASGERDQPAGLLRVSPAVRTLAPLGLYLILSFSFLDNNVNLSEYYYGYSTDSLLFVWFLHWWPFALTHGLNPFLSNYAWFPTGYNFAWATSIPFYALLMWPVTSLGGPVLSYNILALSMPAFSAWTAYLLARDFTKNFAPALICGLLFGFSMPEMYQAGELNIGSIFFIPLAVLLCARRLQGRLGRKTFVILLSLLLAAQLGMSTEVLAMLCLMGALSWAIFLLFAPAAARPAFWRLAVDIALAA
ncbi:MAG TPA: hypothetical protein VEQ16_03420, partial [Acidocella sp.]|nr:hypothetical protein [Acidocella sp.]